MSGVRPTEAANSAPSGGVGVGAHTSGVRPTEAANSAPSGGVGAHASTPSVASGPLVWMVTMVATTLLLAASTKALWLVVPFLLAIILYYILYPIVRRLVVAGVARETAATLAAGGFALVAVALMVPTLSWLAAQSMSGEEALGRYFEAGRTLVEHTAAALESQFAYLRRMDFQAGTARGLAEFSDTFLQRRVADALLGFAVWLPSLLLAPFLAYFFLREGGRFLKLLMSAVPNAFFERTLHMMDRVHGTARRYFMGLLKLAVIDTAFLAVGLSLLGVAGALLLGTIAALLALVPVIGPIIGGIMVTLAAATQFPGESGMVYATVGLFLLGRLLDDFVFMPMTVGRSLEIHPLPTVLMIFIGGTVAGAPGLILAVPLTGVVNTVVGTIGAIVIDPRLRARHAFGKALQTRRINADLRL